MIPRRRDGNEAQAGPDPEAHAGDRVVRGFQPEEERLTGRQNVEGRVTRAPEVHFIEIGPAREEAIPLEISIGDPGPHLLRKAGCPTGHSTSPRAMISRCGLSRSQVFWPPCSLNGDLQRDLVKYSLWYSNSAFARTRCVGHAD